MKTYLTPAGTNYTQADIGLAVANSAVAGQEGRVVKVTASSSQILGVIASVGPEDARGQSLGVAYEPGEECEVIAGETFTPGATSPYCTAGANGRWYAVDPGEYHAIRLTFAERAVAAAGDRIKAVIAFGQADTAP